jgi:hypothetical protein
MQFVLFLLAVAGFMAVLRRLGLAAFQALRGGVDSYLLREVASTRAERGDLTGLMEAQSLRKSQRIARWRSVAAVLLWLGALSVPLLTRTPVPIYAVFSILWLLPVRRRRPAT